MSTHRRTFDPFKGKKIDLWTAVLVAIVTVLGAVLCTIITTYYRNGKGTHGREGEGIPSPSLAEFPAGEEYPRNSYNYEWKVFNDGKYLGNSLIWYEVLDRTDRTNDRFLRVHIATGTRYHLPYCGVYTDFSYPPYQVLDVSQYKGIEFDARWLPEPNTTNVPQFFIQVAMLGTPYYKYHEMEFSIPPGDTRFALVRIPFSVLRTPSHAETQYDFDPRKMFRIGFTVKGKDMKGYLDLDSVRLFQ